MVIDKTVEQALIVPDLPVKNLKSSISLSITVL